MKNKRPNKKKKLKLKMNVLIKLLIIILICGGCFGYIRTLKIKNIIITGTTNIKDVEIIEAAEIKDYPPIYKLNINKIKEQIKTIPLIKDVKIKRNIWGKLTIEVNEDKVLFFYKYNNKYITSSGQSIKNNAEYYGFPILINFTPDTVFEDFVNGLNKVDIDIIKMINEIEYTPYKDSNGNVIDNNRFTLKMNDTNTVVIDTVNMKNLNKYITIIASPDMDVEKGIVYLDSVNSDNIYFKSYKTLEEEQAMANDDDKDKDKEN